MHYCKWYICDVTFVEYIPLYIVYTEIEMNSSVQMKCYFNLETGKDGSI